MGAGGVGDSLAYHQSVNLTLQTIGAPVLVDLLDSVSMGTGFDSATFKILSNGNLFDSQSFTDLASADAYFSHHLLALQLGAGLNDIQLLFDEMMSSGEGFSFDYRIRGVVSADTPLPSALPLFATGLGVLGLLGWRRKRKSAALAA